ncbi:MAG: hypothetical protein A2W19_01800 [Spirochaetes bacterium RBG_16_49_21]|nr:MAG: hypothetical protein A2W19_01800 [Spirochaetes bacterium RBG_16_49_21]
MYDFIRGPMLWISFIVFMCGLVFQFYKIFSITGKKEAPSLIRKDANNKGLAKLKKYLNKALSSVALKGTILGTQPFVALLSFIFHVCIIATPLFLLAHNILLFESWRFRLFSLSESTTDIMTVVFLACAALFLIRRIFIPTVRAVSGIYDYLLLLVAAAPFITGFLAYHQLVDYETIIIIHIISGELMLIAVGLTKLGHMIFFFFVRLHIGSEYSFRGGSRSWQ